MLKMLAKTRKAINKDLTELTFNTYFEGIPLDTISSILEERCYHFEDVILCGAEGRTTLDIFSSASDEIISNVVLCISWYKMPSGRYEVVVYAS